MIMLLGLVTIAAYGAWFYAFGVLLDPILTETGWPESGVAAVFSVSALLGSVSAVAAGRFVDSFGARAAFAAAAVVSSIGLGVAADAQSFWTFAVGAVLGGAALQALAFYHVTQTTAVRAAPSNPSRAIATLTIYGAFSSAIYLPLAAWLVTMVGWRDTLRILVGGTAVVLVAAAILVRERSRGERRSRATGGLRRGFRRPAARRFAIAASLVGFCIGIMMVYQVPLMTGAGLPVGVAAWMAGARGAAQITGRIPLGFIVGRLGARSSVRLSYAMITVAVLILPVAGNVIVALLYVAVAGFGIGATSPLTGIYADELFDRADLGASMGVLTMAAGLSTAIGPVMVGAMADATGSRWWGVAIAMLAGLVAVMIIGGSSTPSDSDDGAVGDGTDGDDDQEKASISREPAAARVSSRLAKQNRTSRSPSRRS